MNVQWNELIDRDSRVINISIKISLVKLLVNDVFINRQKVYPQNSAM